MPLWGWTVIRLLLEFANELILDTHSKVSEKEPKRSNSFTEESSR